MEKKNSNQRAPLMPTNQDDLSTRSELGKARLAAIKFLGKVCGSDLITPVNLEARVTAAKVLLEYEPTMVERQN